MALSPGGQIYVADVVLSRIVILEPDGTRVGAVGRPGFGDSELDSPSSVAVDGVGRIIVADEGNNWVQVIAQDGTFLAQWGRPTDAPGGMRSPTGVAVDHQGFVDDVDVVDGGFGSDSLHYLPRLQKYTIEGNIVSEVTASSTAPDYLSPPSGIAVSPIGSHFVSYGWLPILVEFDVNLKPTRRFAMTEDRQPDELEYLGRLRRVAFTASGDLFVVDETREPVARIDLP